MVSPRLLAGFLALLLVAVGGATGFLHTETDGRFDPECPACQLQASALGESLVPPAHETVIVVVDRVTEPALQPRGSHHQPSSILLRAPPQL